MSRPRLDLIAVAAAVLALVMMVVYLSIMRQGSDGPAAWFVSGFILGAAAAGYGAITAAPHRGAALVLAGVVLAAMGVLAILSIGFPILVASVLCVFSAARSTGIAPSEPSGQ